MSECGSLHVFQPVHLGQFDMTCSHDCVTAFASRSSSESNEQFVHRLHLVFSNCTSSNFCLPVSLSYFIFFCLVRFGRWPKPSEVVQQERKKALASMTPEERKIRNALYKRTGMVRSGIILRVSTLEVVFVRRGLC